jgi:transposase
MRKVNYKEEIKESVELLEARYKGLSKPKLQARCEVLIWLKRGEVGAMKKAAGLKGLSATQGQRWWRQYKSEGLDAFLSSKHKGQVSPLKGKSGLDERLDGEGFNTINEAREWISKTYNIDYKENSLGNYFRRNKIKLKTGRPHHPKKDGTARVAYKKGS